jgi:hypothetical protein
MRTMLRSTHALGLLLAVSCKAEAMRGDSPGPFGGLAMADAPPPPSSRGDYDGSLALWNVATPHVVVDAPLPVDVSIARPIVTVGAAAADFERVKYEFADALQRNMVHYANGKRVFRNCTSDQSRGGLRIETSVEVSRFDGTNIVARGVWRLLASDGTVLASREQPLAQEMHPNVILNDFGAYHYFLRDSAPIIQTQLAAKATSQPQTQPQPQPRKAESVLVVAAFDVQDGSGSLNPEALAQLSEYLAVKLTETSRFRVIPRTQILDRLRQTKSDSHAVCVDEACHIEIGKNLAASKSLATKLIKVGDNCVLASTMFDLKTETTEKAASVTTGCGINSMLGGVDELTKKLAASN